MWKTKKLKFGRIDPGSFKSLNSLFLPPFSFSTSLSLFHPSKLNLVFLNLCFFSRCFLSFDFSGKIFLLFKCAEAEGWLWSGKAVSISGKTDKVKWSSFILTEMCEGHSRLNFTNILWVTFVQKLYEQLFCSFILGLYFFLNNKLVEKLLLKCWWNWLKDKTFY